MERKVVQTARSSAGIGVATALCAAYRLGFGAELAVPAQHVETPPPQRALDVMTLGRPPKSHARDARQRSAPRRD